jgi:hypothetical protein
MQHLSHNERSTQFLSHNTEQPATSNKTKNMDGRLQEIVVAKARRRFSFKVFLTTLTFLKTQA